MAGAKNHEYHILPPSPWPLLSSFAALVMAAGGIMYMHQGTGGGWVFLIGLASVLAPDSQMGAQSAALGRLGSLAAAVLVLGSGLYALPLRALAESYAVLPVGAPWPAGPAAEAMVAAGSALLEIALRLAAPFVMAALLVNLGMGLLARVAPQVQVHIVGAPGQILAGMALLGLVAPPLLAAFEEALRAAWAGLPGLG